MNLEFLNTLQSVIDDRIENPADGSYTATLASAGTKRIAQKVGEEGVELALAAVAGDAEEIRDECADLLYHLLVLLRMQGISLGEVCAVLEQRHKV